jgi:antitoxin ParD1/3/4
MISPLFGCVAFAAQEGIADIDAGRFKTFESKQGLRDHMQGIAAKVRTVQ